MTDENQQENVTVTDTSPPEAGAEPPTKPPEEHKKRFFILRSATCLIVPTTLAAYYTWNYVLWLRPGTKVSTTNTPNLNGRLVWWSWFVIGALGLNISNYSLAGVEAGMIASGHFIIEKDQIVWHMDKSWSTLGGWKIAGTSFYAIVFKRATESPKPSVPWIILFVLSVFSWAFVLCGLTMEVESGFAKGKDAGVLVTGINVTTTNKRSPWSVYDTAFQRWKSGDTPRVPGGGALYTPAGSSIIANTTSANILPRNASEGLFIAPQAELPVTGSAWGLLLNYSCSVVHNLSDFTILSNRMNSTHPGYIHDYLKGINESDISTINYYYLLMDGSSINVLSQQKVELGKAIPTFRGIAEIGLSQGFDKIFDDRNSTYSNGTIVSPSDYHHGKVDVLEFILWQMGYKLPKDNPNFYSRTVFDVQNPIPGLETEHLNTRNGRNDLIPAVGIRCTSSSTMGNATIDGLANTFTDFTREDPHQDAESKLYGVARLGYGTPAMLLKTNTSAGHLDGLYDYLGLQDPILKANYSSRFHLVSRNVDWMQPLFQAAGIRQWFVDSLFASYEGAIQAEDLKHAVESAYGHYALQLMFNGHEAIAWMQPDLTAVVPWPIIVGTTDGVPPLFVLICLVIWATGCVVLGVVYAVRKRWRETFDGYSLLQFSKEKLDSDVTTILETS